MGTPRLVGAVDVGTSRVKAAVFEEESWRLVGSVEYRLKLRVGGGGRVEHDPGEIAGAVRAAVARLREWGACCAGVSVFRGSVLAWSRDGRALTMLATWMDRRTLYWRPSLGVRVGRLLPVLRVVFLPGSPALAMRVLLEEEGLLEKARRGEVYAWTLDAYLAYLATRRFLADPASSALTGLLDPRSLRPMRIAESLLGLSGIAYPELLPHDTPFGSYHGVSLGPLIADQQAAVIGLGCLGEGCLKISMGTGVFADRVTGEARTPFTTDLIPVLVFHDSGGRRVYGVEGFAAGVGAAVDALVEAGVLDSYDMLEGAPLRPVEGVAVVPVLGGLRTPYSPLAGLLVAVLNPRPTKDGVAAALAHGVALTGAAVALRVEEYTGSPAVVRVGGGLARSRRILELLASYLGRSVEVAGDHYDSARGAALLAALAHGVIGWRDLRAWKPPAETVEPAWDGRRRARSWYRLLKRLANTGFWEALYSMPGGVGAPWHSAGLTGS